MKINFHIPADTGIGLAGGIAGAGEPGGELPARVKLHHAHAQTLV